MAGPAAPAQDLAGMEGQRLFEIHCSFCHGPRGEGGKAPTLAQPELPRAPDAEALIKIIKSGISGTEMPGLPLPRQALTALADYVRSLGSRPQEVVPGDPANGALLYATKGACATCHTLRGNGVAIGPDLSTIGRSRSAAYLRRALIEPGAEVPQSQNQSDNFVLVRVTTREGRAVAGVRVNEDTFSIQLRDLNGKLHSFFKRELATLEKDWGVSPMPSYAGVFSAGEFDDLVAFLASLRGAKKSP